MKKFYILAFLVLISACAPKDPTEGINDTTRNFIFGEDESVISFMGRPVNNGELQCDPRVMNQGYVFKQDKKRLWLESLRPGSTERDRVVKISETQNGFEVMARNAANLPFTLDFSNISSNGARIAFDNEDGSDYIRCVQ